MVTDADAVTVLDSRERALVAPAAIVMLAGTVAALVLCSTAGPPRTRRGAAESVACPARSRLRP